jgi:hypothetical protein
VTRILLFSASILSALSVSTAQGQPGTSGPVPRVEVQPDGLVVCEAEEFTVTSPGWKPGRWGENYYAATFANAFLSRKAFLGSPEQADDARATIRVNVPAAGRYLVLVRYEAAYRFETQFKVVVEQGGAKVLDRLYGARGNLKIWAFRQGLKSEVGWDWGAGENVVWEGHDAFADLKPGEATITLVAGRQPEPAARRNVDLVMLTTDASQVKTRIEKENYLPLDGMLTQSGDVWLRVTNPGGTPIVFASGKAPAGGNWQEHSPYWVHMRNWKPASIKVEPGRTSDWVEVGGLMDSLNDGQWTWSADGPYQAEFGVKGPAGQIEPIATFTGEKGDLALAADADTRRSRRLRKTDQVLYDLLDYLKQQPAHGRTPERTPIFGYTFTPIAGDARHVAAVAEFKRMFGLADVEGQSGSRGRGFVDVRGVPTDKLADYCQKLGDAAREMLVVSLGDEISLPAPPKNDATHGAFRSWLKTRGLRPADIDSAAGDDWAKIHYDPDPAGKTTRPGVFYWSVRYQYHAGIQGIKERTDILRRHLPNAGIGANFSPHYPTEHMFLGEVYKWVSVFREDGMTLPWAEDYVWQVPVVSPQVNHLNLDLFRAGLRGKPGRGIHYYVMPHAPNNTPRTWRRLFYGALAHGMKQVNLFEFRPVHVAYTENHVSNPAMYATVLRSFRELGLFEDIIQDGQVRGAEAGLWFSETSDIWGDTHGSFGAAKRCLYTAIRHQQIPLDVVVEQDALDGTLAQYKVLYLADRHVSRAASDKIAAWVRAGGMLFATAGAGMRDELDRPNTTLLDLYGLKHEVLEAPEGRQVKFEKQDLPFAEPIDAVLWSPRSEVSPMSVIGVKSRVQLAGATVTASFKDGTPAVTTRGVDKGNVTFCAFLPGLSYFRPAIPRRPVDRGATEDSMTHFLPTAGAPDALGLIAFPFNTAGLSRPVQCSTPRVEATIVESKHGVAIPLVNWTRDPIKDLKVTITATLPAGRLSLASGGQLAVQREGNRLILTLDLDAADVVIAR